MLDRETCNYSTFLSRKELNCMYLKVTFSGHHNYFHCGGVLFIWGVITKIIKSLFLGSNDLDALGFI